MAEVPGNKANEDADGKDDLIRRISLLKRNAMAAPFEQAFDEFHQLQEEASKYTSESAPQGIAEGGETRAIHYREEEAIYIKASHDRVTVIFSTVFREETDRVFGKVFLQVRFLSTDKEAWADSGFRNSSMPGGERYRTHRKCCSGTNPH